MKKLMGFYNAKLKWWQEFLVLIASFLFLVGVSTVVLLIAEVNENYSIIFLGSVLLIPVFLVVMWALSYLLKDSKKVMLKVTIVGGLFGFFLSLFQIPYAIWSFGEIFFPYPTSSIIMGWGCLDSCPPNFFLIRTLITSAFFAGLALIIALIVQSTKARRLHKEGETEKGS